MRDLPRELSAEQLAELFEGRTAFVELLAAEPAPLVRARTLVHELPPGESARSSTHIPRSASEPDCRRAQRQSRARTTTPEVLAELARLNTAYEAAPRVPLRHLREPAAEGGDPRGAPLADRQPDRRGARDRARRARRDRRGSLAARVSTVAQMSDFSRTCRSLALLTPSHVMGVRLKSDTEGSK